MPGMTIDGQATVDLQGLLNYKGITDIILTDNINHKRRVEGILEAGLTKNIEAIHSTSVSEAAGEASIMQAQVAPLLTTLGIAANALVATAQQLMKGAQTTPPATP